MIYTIVEKLKVIYVFRTDYQNVVENFCEHILNLKNDEYNINVFIDDYKYEEFIQVYIDAKFVGHKYKYTMLVG